VIRAFWPLTARGTGAVALAVVCFLVAHEVGLDALVYFAVLLLGAVVAGVVSLHLSRRTEAVTRALDPDAAAVGRRSAVRVRVGVRSALPTTPGTWDDALPSGLAGRAGGIFPALGSGRARAGSLVELRYEVEGVARGVHALGPLSVTVSDPFGLARRRFRLGAATPVTVAPAIVDLLPVPATPGEAGGMLQTATAQPGQGSDNLVARPYAPGDSMRRIHWRATAHRDELRRNRRRAPRPP
jgi:uncharacterized protein (DUF58 family)